MSTLTDDRVYELAQTGHRWEGYAGATAFYLELLGAFPDVVFDLADIVIGPQGVCEMADVTATHRGSWLGGTPTGKAVRWRVASSSLGMPSSGCSPARRCGRMPTTWTRLPSSPGRRELDRSPMKPAADPGAP